jgi:hypothetical protein
VLGLDALDEIAHFFDRAGLVGLDAARHYGRLRRRSDAVCDGERGVANFGPRRCDWQKLAADWLAAADGAAPKGRN